MFAALLVASMSLGNMPNHLRQSGIRFARTTVDQSLTAFGFSARYAESSVAPRHFPKRGKIERFAQVANLPPNYSLKRTNQSLRD